MGGWSSRWVVKWVGGQVGVAQVCVYVVKVCGQCVCGLSVCRGQVGGWWSGWVMKWVGGQSGWQYISHWRAWSTDSEYINFLAVEAVGALGAEILSPEFHVCVKLFIFPACVEFISYIFAISESACANKKNGCPHSDGR